MNSDDPVPLKSGTNPLQTVFPSGNLPAIPVVSEVSLAEKLNVDRSTWMVLE